MRHAYSVPVMAAILFVTACGPSDRQTEASKEEAMAEKAATADCPVFESRGWKAWVNTMPGPDAKPTLLVTGIVGMPTPGFTFEWQMGPADRAMPPAQHLRLVATAPGGMVAQVVTSETVTYEGDALSTQYRAIVVHCGETVLAELSDIGQVQ